MDSLAAGFWGAFFATVALMMVAALGAFARSLQRVALNAALSALVSALFTLTYLGLWPIKDTAVEARVLSHVAIGTSVLLGLLLLATLRGRRYPPPARWPDALLMGTGVVTVALSWWLEPVQSLVLGSAVALAVGVGMLLASLRKAFRGDRMAWAAVLAVGFMLVAIAGLSWIALNRSRAAWPVHAFSALAGMAYLATLATALWWRYAYLIEVREIMVHGPSYDPVTRMRTHEGTGQMLGALFFQAKRESTQPVGVVVVSIANLYALENLHGRAAFNHALFICASRLRRCVPADVEMGRLSNDGFLLLKRHCGDVNDLVRLAQQLAQRLSRPVVLGKSRRAADLEAPRTEWVAEVGVGLLAAAPSVKPADAVAMARAMSHTAWSYAARVAWFDEATGQIAEVPTDIAKAS